MVGVFIQRMLVNTLGTLRLFLIKAEVAEISGDPRLRRLLDSPLSMNVMLLAFCATICLNIFVCYNKSSIFVFL